MTLETDRFFGGCRVHALVAPIVLAIVIFTGSVVGVIGQCTQPNVVVDGGFETGGIPNTFWNPETSTNFGTPLCDVPSCGTGGGASPPRTGAFWLWFGGIPAVENASLGQTVTFPAGGVATLRFFMRIGTVSSPFTDVVRVRVDGTIVASYPEPTVAEGAYSLKEINLNAYANGAAHALLFEYAGPSTGTGSFVIDDVSINACVTSAANVSISGRVFGLGGSSRSKASVTLTDTEGNSQTVLTNAFGYYRFDEVESGHTYTISVASKTAVYAPRLVNVDGELSDIDFMPIE